MGRGRSTKGGHHMRAYLRTAMAAGIAAAGMAISPGAASAGEQLALVERARTDAVTDLGAKGDSVGVIYDKDNKTLVGHDNGWCVRTVVGQAWECIWTLTTDKGQLTVEGPFYDTKDSVLAVTGGTGAYATARGEMKFHVRDANGSEADFVYTLVP